MEPLTLPVNQPLASVSAGLAVMRHVTPPQCVIHIGAGNGGIAGRQWKDLAVAQVVMIDAHPAVADQLANAVAEAPQWHSASLLLGADEAESVPFLVTSNPSANGCVPIERLRALWPNLRELETLKLPQRRLDQFLDTSHPQLAAQANWLVIDCFPALPILAGAGRYLDQLDLVCSRAILNPELLDVEGSSMAELTAYLTPQGFRQVALSEGLHPALGDAIFVRDAQAKRAAERQAQLATLTQERDAQTTLAAERLAQLATLTQERDAQTTLAAERQAQLATLTQERDAQTELAAGRQAQLATLRQERDAQTQLAAERQ
ncbi:hypothetical protein, partial [uncultured Thiodictyon sp.]|uniref:hypothetical protein n=1 Tax=uncultured Thiodictyon sp. TaxID=1846217 RepID=UPI0025D6F49F